MELAYDHIQESALSPDERSSTPKPEDKDIKNAPPVAASLNADFQEAYKAISASPWGARLGGFWGGVVKQADNVYNEVSKGALGQELREVGEEASKGFGALQTQILSRTQGLSLGGKSATDGEGEGEGRQEKDAEAHAQSLLPKLPALPTMDALRTGLTRIQKAEDAADEALLKAGTSVFEFFRDAVKIAAPAAGAKEGAVLFESKDAAGKRVIHTTRFEAQLHVIHSSLESFEKDPEGEEFVAFTKEFDVEKKTGDIATDLDKYEELRTAMEQLVPDQVAYAEFWKRYYFLRQSIETAEEKRRELLKGATASAEEEVGWDEDSDDEAPSKPVVKAEKASTAAQASSVDSSTTINNLPTIKTDDTHLKTGEQRRSHDEKSQADSEASYDVVGNKSGLPSTAPDSPREVRKADESEEEDWE